MKEAVSSSETSVLTRSTRRNIPEGTTLHFPVLSFRSPLLHSSWVFVYVFQTVGALSTKTGAFRDTASVCFCIYCVYNTCKTWKL
jgi:hypothetical protein